MSAIAVSGLVKYYGRTKAVDNLSFSVERGEVYAILGPNGAGKTTTIKAVAGLIRFDSGRILVLGRDVRSQALEVKRLVGIMPELPNLFGDLSVRDNLEFLARLYGLGRRERKERISYLAELLGLGSVLRMKYAALSKGLKRRADLAAALLHNPEILILDEPTGGLDVRYAVAIRALVKRLAREGRTVLLTTHNIPEAMELADRVLVINRGKRIAEGSPRELRRMAGLRPVVEIVFRSLTRGIIDEMRRLWGGDNVVVRGVSVLVSNVDTASILKGLALLVEKFGAVVEQVNTMATSWDEVLLRILRHGGSHG